MYFFFSGTQLADNGSCSDREFLYQLPNNVQASGTFPAMNDQPRTGNGAPKRRDKRKDNAGAPPDQLTRMRKKSGDLSTARKEERQEAFLACLHRHNGVISHALSDPAMRGMNYRTLRRWREEEAFIERYEEAIEAGLDRLAAVATRLATGTFDPDIPPCTTTLRFLLGHLHQSFKKDPDETTKIELLVGKREESVEDLKRLLEDSRTRLAPPTDPPTGPPTGPPLALEGGGVPARRAGSGSPAQGPNSAGSHDDDS